MGEALVSFSIRRTRNVAILIVLGLICLLAFQILELSLVVQQYYSGWVLAILICSLLLYGVKKHFSILNVGKSASWAQWHYYCGWLVLLMFLIHIEFSIPTGSFEVVLAILLCSIIGVGIFGLVMNRLYAKRLAQLNYEVVYERISFLRNELKAELEAELFESVKQSKSSTLTDYYYGQLSNYFAKPHDTIGHLIGSSYSHRNRETELEYQLRYLNQEEAGFVIKMTAYLRKKFMLDCHLALQAAMKYWTLLHAPLAIGLSLLIVLHIVLVYAFRGAA